MSQAHLRWPIALSIVAAVLTIGMKATAYALTGSVGLFSDALESGVNLLAAVTAYFSLLYAARPADPNHTYGHEKIEFFSSGLEGVLILVAGVGTAVYAARRLVHPQPLDGLEVGIVISLGASAILSELGYFSRISRKRISARRMLSVYSLPSPLPLYSIAVRYSSFASRTFTFASRFGGGTS